AILRLDARVPLSAVTPMHVPLNGYPRCHEELGGSFDGEIIGFGNCQPFNSAVDCPGTPNYPRTFGTVGGWGREWVRPEPPFFPCFEHTPPLPLDPPIPCTTDLPGGVYASYWQLLQPLNYNGILGGDSGGP